MKMRSAQRMAACCVGALLTFASAGLAHADVVSDWNQTALRATEIADMPPPAQLRVMALVHAAIYDAINGMERKFTRYAIEATVIPDASVEAAAAGAAYETLDRLFPQQKVMTAAALAVSLKEIADGPARANGLRIGREVAEKLLALRLNDGASDRASYEFSKGDGVYQSTPPMEMKPVLPHWRAVKPFLLTSNRQFPLAGPPAVGSPNFIKDLDEVKRLGAKASTERTSQQTAIAIHWAGSEVTPLNAVARAAASNAKLSLVDEARLFALMNMAMADALIAGFEAKYSFNHWRPVTAIRASSDPAWEPLLVTPPHQDYPSGHALAAGAAVAVLQAVIGSDQVKASYVYPPLGVLRRWERFSQIVKEVEDARVWGGIHFRTADEHGTHLGQQIAEYGLKTFMLAKTN